MRSSDCETRLNLQKDQVLVSMVCPQAFLLTAHSKLTVSDFVGVKPSASQDEINKAYRKKSRLIHPDKAKQNFIASKSKPSKPKPGSKKKPGVRVTKGPSQKEIQLAVKEAQDRFARLGVIAEILRGPGRDRYDHFLKNGFPRWRGTGYYYTRFRPGLGSVLLGLFIVGGGAAHYGALILGWKQRRDFVERYIRRARRAAWGDEMGIPGIDVGRGTATPALPAEAEGAVAMNRRQKRMMEKENKKEKGDKKQRSSRRGTDSPAEQAGPRGDKKRVVAENGKILVVDSIGNVFLEEETEDGGTEEFLLDINEIPRPTIHDTILIRLPKWLYARAIGHIIGSSKAEEESNEGLEESEPEFSVDTPTPAPKANGAAKKKNKTGGKAQ
jgi:curved DNA-binding protein CbpA